MTKNNLLSERDISSVALRKLHHLADVWDMITREQNTIVTTLSAAKKEGSGTECRNFPRKWPVSNVTYSNRALFPIRVRKHKHIVWFRLHFLKMNLCSPRIWRADKILGTIATIEFSLFITVSYLSTITQFHLLLSVSVKRGFWNYVTWMESRCLRTRSW
jgi:hypothetical protein